MGKTTSIIIARHGETEANAAGTWQGHEDSPLTENGRRQADALGGRLAGEVFSALYSSDLGRAYSTAASISRATGHEIAVDVRLRERHLGIFQGLNRESLAQAHPEEWERYKNGGPDYVIPGGESARQRLDRSFDCIQEIADRHVGETVVVVSHGGVLSGLMRRILGIPLESPRRFNIWNAGINVFEREEGGWRLKTWGDIGHLDNPMTLYYE